MSTFTAVISDAVDDNERLVLIAIVALFVLLVAKEVAAGFHAPRSRRLDRVLTIPILPLLLVFACAVVVRFVDLLR